MTKFRKFCKTTAIGRILLIPWRLSNAARYLARPAGQALAWVFTSREHYNYTYHLDPLNRKYLIAFVSAVTGRDYFTIEKFFIEIEQDAELQRHIVNSTRLSSEKYIADEEARFGRRIGWYAMVRAVKPRVVVETGVDKGLGCCVLAAAILKNRSEGSHGKFIGIDINPEAGYLFSGKYLQAGEIVFGDSHAVLKRLDETIDFFIHDSDHSAEHERKELAIVLPKVTESALVLSDNSDQTDELLSFARASGRQFLFFSDKPANHWWGGDGIGVAYHKRS